MAKGREALEATATTMEMVVLMAEGNPGALTILADMANDLALLQILALDDMNMRGEQIWIAYKDHCDMDIDKLYACIDKRDPEMIETVNKKTTGHVAVPGGASSVHITKGGARGR